MDLSYISFLIFHRVKYLKARLGNFLLKQELNFMGLSNKSDKLRTEDTLKWRASFQNLLAHKGQYAPNAKVYADYSFLTPL